MAAPCTLKVSNVSPQATAQEIQDFFSFTGHVEKVDLISDGDGSQVAHVTFKDPESLDVAVLLSGSTILDREVIISREHNLHQQAIKETSDDQTVENTRNPGSGALKKAQEIVGSMLSRGFFLGQDVLSRAKLFDEKRRQAPNSAATQEEELHSNNIENDTNDDDGSNNSMGALSPNNTVVKSKARINAERYYKHVMAINEKLQLGQKTMSALAMAQQGVSRTGAVVMSNRYITAGGAWVNGAIARVVTRNNHNEASVSDDSFSSSFSSPSHKGTHEQVQLTEMSTFHSSKVEALTE